MFCRRCRREKLYVWFDAPIGLHFIYQRMGSQRRWLKNRQRHQIGPFYRKRQYRFHCVIFPMLLKAEGSFFYQIMFQQTNSLNLEGNKLSTSKTGLFWFARIFRRIPQSAGCDGNRQILTSNVQKPKTTIYLERFSKLETNNELVAYFGNFIQSWWFWRINGITTELFQHPNELSE